MERKELEHTEASEAERQASIDLERLPPRIVKHATKKSKATRYYYIALVWLFILLTAGLIVWGYRNS